MRPRQILWLVILVAIFFAAFLGSPKVLHYFITEFPSNGAESAEHFGAFVGGYFGSLFALISVVLLFLTLQSQQTATADQNLTNARQHFETKYYEMLRIHRDNVEEITLKDSNGSRVFVLLLRELREALRIVKEAAISSNVLLTEQQFQHIAYYCLFYGTGPNSSRMLKISLSEFNKQFINAIDLRLSDEDTKRIVQLKRKFDYVPFEGHQSRLGHYYRHLYQTVEFVNEQPDRLIPDKYKYVKTIRAQLSTHEQALLLVNSITPLGTKWWERDFMIKYKLVKNIPHLFFDSAVEFDPCSTFPPGYFEWERARQRHLLVPR